MDDVLTRCAKAVWEMREKRYPERVRQTWEQGSDLARVLLLEEVELALTLAINAPPSMWGVAREASLALTGKP